MMVSYMVIEKEDLFGLFCEFRHLVLNEIINELIIIINKLLLIP